MTNGEMGTERLQPPQYPQQPFQAPPRQAPPQTERLIADRYLLTGELGRGGMGIVWRAEDRVIGRAVAVKEMRLGSDVLPAERAEFEQRILREARTAGRLNDPAVVTVFDVVHADGSIFIVMELVQAPTLAELIRSAGPLAPQLVADLGRQVLSALESAHAAGVVHRDVKPSNIMVLPNGRAKLTDFGIAQAADDPTLTKTGMVVGSPAYLAPERLSGHEATAASDIWSLGAALFYAVEGRGAFERDTTAATLSAVIHDVPFLTRCQGPLAAAISGMLTASPEGRLAGVQLRSLLNSAAAAAGGPPTRILPEGGQETFAFGSGGPVPGGFPTGGLAASGPRRSRRTVFAAIGGAFVLAVVSLVAGASMGKTAQKTADVAPYAGVQVLTYGLPGETGTLLYGISSYNECGSGNVPMRPGIKYDVSVDCAKPHEFEDFFAFSLGNDHTPYPDLARLTVAAQAGCYAAASRIRPVAGAQTAALIPSQRLWEGTNLPDGFNADRDVICLQWIVNGQLPPKESPSTSG